LWQPKLSKRTSRRVVVLQFISDQQMSTAVDK